MTNTGKLAESAAPLDVLLVDAARGPARRFLPDLSTAKWAVSLARNPGSHRPAAGRPGRRGRPHPHRLLNRGAAAGGPPVQRRRLDREPDAEAAGPALPGRRTDRRAAGERRRHRAP